MDAFTQESEYHALISEVYTLIIHSTMILAYYECVLRQCRFFDPGFYCH